MKYRLIKSSNFIVYDFSVVENQNSNSESNSNSNN